jgi:hypothetical protein
LLKGTTPTTSFLVIFILPVLFVITLVPGLISVMHDMETLGVSRP